MLNSGLKSQIEELKSERQQLIVMLNLHRPTCIVRTDSVKSPESDERRAELSDWTQTLYKRLLKRSKCQFHHEEEEEKGNRFVWILNKHPRKLTDYCKSHLHVLSAASVLFEEHVFCQLIWPEAWRSPRSLQMALSDKPHCSLTPASPWMDCLLYICLRCIYYTPCLLYAIFILFHHIMWWITCVLWSVSVERPLFVTK